ncbi:MAG: hypothetical protein Fur0018_01380 [Anaerolineales bacterium]
MPVIKRYPNRKLYDTEAKSYVTLNEIADQIRTGADIHVVDHESGEDLTTLILSQIILEQEKQQSGFLPRNILSELVRAGGSRVSKIQRALVATFDWWGEFDAELRRRFDLLVEHGELTVQEAETLSQKLSRIGGQHPEKSIAQATEEQFSRLLEKRGIPSRDELQALMEQLDRLNRQIETLTPPESKP